MDNYRKDLSKVKAFIFDVDGVFTDGIIILSPDGEQLRTMNVKDGYALQLAAKKGYQIAIISGGISNSVQIRFERLGLTDIFMGVSNKLEVYETYISQKGISSEEVLYMGDDIPDFQIMNIVGMPVCPNDAVDEIKKISKYISHANGGKGCVRDVIEQTMKVQGKWLDYDSFIW